MSNEILVSICSTTYNHAPYIRQCLDGFLMQYVNFRYEILIHDDASTDGTDAIIKEYAEKYPDIIKPLYEIENQYRTNNPKGMMFWNVSRAKGRYVALCEGDDYWTDPLKLQKQVDFLEANLDYSVCGHNFLAYDDAKSIFEKFNTGIDGMYQLYDLIHRHVFCSTLSIVFRRSALDIEYYSRCRRSIDIVWTYMLLKNGKGFCMADEMAVYRVHGGGVWSGTQSDYQTSVNVDVRLAIYELERTRDAAVFIITYLQKVGRRWLIKNLYLLMKALKYIREQFGVKYTTKLITNILFKI